jgi:hypothetical protein
LFCLNTRQRKRFKEKKAAEKDEDAATDWETDGDQTEKEAEQDSPEKEGGGGEEVDQDGGGKEVGEGEGGDEGDDGAEDNMRGLDAHQVRKYSRYDLADLLKGGWTEQVTA